jgi:hypothetical protein
MNDLSHLSTDKYVVKELRDFTEDLDLDETICALCGLTPDLCPCYIHPPHSCSHEGCNCACQEAKLICSCCLISICDCDLKNGI